MVLEYDCNGSLFGFLLIFRLLGNRSNQEKLIRNRTLMDLESIVRRLFNEVVKYYLIMTMVCECFINIVITDWGAIESKL